MDFTADKLRARKTGFFISLGILLLTLGLVTQVLAAPRPTLTANPNPIVRDKEFTLYGTGFSQHRNITVTFSDGTPDLVLKVVGGSFNVKRITNSTAATLKVDAYDTQTTALLATLN